MPSDPRPVAIRILALEALPDGLTGLEGYGSVLTLVRRGVEPVVLAELPVRDGTVDGATLRDAVVWQGAWRAASLELRDWLSGEPPAARPTATVAVCTRDRPDDLERCLTALEALPGEPELLVVDSASASPATAEVAARHPRVRYVREAEPGADRARNRALREARGDIVAYCDDDAVVDPGWLDALLRNFRDPRTLCVTGLTLPLELETPAQIVFERTNGFGRGLDARRFDGLVDDPFLVARIGASVNMALRRECLELIGPFDEALDGGTPSRSGGDHDYFARILVAGYAIVYEPAALSQHRHRRDWAGLRAVIEGYGTGVYAYLTKHLVRHRELRVLGIMAGWGRWQLRQLLWSLLRRPGALPLELVTAELRGCAAGPRGYFRSVRLLRERSAAESGT